MAEGETSLTRYIDEWSKDKPGPLAMAAIELAFDAEYYFKCAKQVKKAEGFINKSPIPPLNEWLSLYKDHHRIFDSRLQSSTQDGL